ncbi:MAG: saccharopine dehydrogenase family protein [Acidimicrobiia bacterium]
MTTALLVGIGAVGGRAARQLIETPGIDRVLVADRRTETAVALQGFMNVEALEWAPPHAPPSGVGVIAAAVPDDEDLAIARCALEHGVPFVSAADDHDAVTALLGLDADARAAGVVLAGGCGRAPGLADVLACHAARALDTVEEVHVARAGVAGPSSATVVRRARGEKAVEWRDGAWRDARAAGPELVWFPDPIGPRDCELAAGGLDLLVRAMPQVLVATLRLAEPPARGVGERLNERLTGRSAPEGWGATRVEVHGTRGSARELIVYGVVERTAVAAGTVLALVAAHLSGALVLGAPGPAGVHGAGELVDPVRFLAELSRRGVKAAVFEGVAVS